jgi:hypothetical protein
MNYETRRVAFKPYPKVQTEGGNSTNDDRIIPSGTSSGFPGWAIAVIVVVVVIVILGGIGYYI